MLKIDGLGNIIDPRIKLHLFRGLEHGALRVARGIIIHQTDSYSAESTLSQYARPGSNGAHFLIDKDPAATIYQTASVLKQTWHVGAIKSRCFETNTCSPSDREAILAARNNSSAAQGARIEHQLEMRKNVPDRYPANVDAIGIELVGKAIGPKNLEVYEMVTHEQNAALKWLIAGLTETLHIPMSEIFRHPQVSRKNRTEAISAQWL